MRSRRGPGRTVNDIGIALVRGVPHLFLRRERHLASCPQRCGRGGVSGVASSPSRRSPRVRRGVWRKAVPLPAVTPRFVSEATKTNHLCVILGGRKRLFPSPLSSSPRHTERPSARRRPRWGTPSSTTPATSTAGKARPRGGRYAAFSCSDDPDASSPRVSSRPTIAASVVGRDMRKRSSCPYHTAHPLSSSRRRW